MTRGTRAALAVGTLALVCAGGWEWNAGSRGTSSFDGNPIPGNGNGLLAVYDPGTHDIVLEMDPVDSIPANANHMGFEQPCSANARIPVDGWVLGYSVELFDKNGEKLPATMIHHVNIIVPERRELFSPIMQRLGAAGKETGAVIMPRFLGYPVKKGDRIIVSAMLENPTPHAHQGVRVRVHLRYVRSDVAISPVRVYPFYVDVMPPAGIHEFDLPAGHFEKSWEGSPAVAGRIIGMGGHMHKYGQSLRFEDITAHKVLYDVKPAVDSAGNVTGVPRSIPVWRFGIPLSPDHTYRLTVVYDNPTGAVIPGGGMGVLGGILITTQGAGWPPADVNDPQYIADVAVTMDGHTHTMPAMSMPIPGMMMP